MRPVRARFLVRSAAVLILLALLAAPELALAGGWASVRLDEAPGQVVAGEPWQFGFTVKAHDVTPIEGIDPVIRAVHRETGEAILAEGWDDGAVGHYLAEVTFPAAGEWKWSIRPGAYPETSMETLTVAAEPGAMVVPPAPRVAEIWPGACGAARETAAFPLMDLTAPTTIPPTATPFGDHADVAARAIAGSTSVVGASMDELVTGDFAVAIEGRKRAGLGAVCGEIAGAVEGGQLVVALRPTKGAGSLGLALFQGDGATTRVSLYLLDLAGGTDPAAEPAVAKGGSATIEIAEGNLFMPARLEVERGTTVTWINRSAIVHTVAGEELAFDDSGLLEPGQSFSQTFEKAGVYAYFCGPHPEMVGEVVVT